MGFCHLTISAPKPLPPEYPRELSSLGDHLRKRRLDRGLLQKEVAEILGVTTMTINAWETGRDEPKVSYVPAIIGFIGYAPFSGEMSFGERLRVERWKLGLTQKKFARRLAQSYCQELWTANDQAAFFPSLRSCSSCRSCCTPSSNCTPALTRGSRWGA
ncbi:MAG TPA: helix-turn-helix transcriptional regulator, partial [Thermoanaerobaculia bacterium]|nr:helix-turn-helix transcriptional regulator [Thermoanaerobaculia bacterium]